MPKKTSRPRGKKIPNTATLLVRGPLVLSPHVQRLRDEAAANLAAEERGRKPRSPRPVRAAPEAVREARRRDIDAAWRET